MFQCIVCTKQAAGDDGDEGEQHRENGESGNGTPRRKDPVRSLTAQIRDMALKFTGAYKQCRHGSAGASSSTFNRERELLRPLPDHYDTSSEGVRYPYLGGVGTGSNHPWDLMANFHSNSMGGIVIRGDQTPRRHHHEPLTIPDVVLEEDEVAEEEEQWVAQVEPGIHFHFVSLPNGGNDLRRIRFNRDMFDRRQAQIWWGENYDRIRELYNVQRFNRRSFGSLTRSEYEQGESSYQGLPSGGDSPVAAWLNNSTQRNQQYGSPAITMEPAGQQNMHGAGFSSRYELSFINTSEIESEWIVQDEPGVFLTIRQSPDGSKVIRRIRFSRQRFGDEAAKRWWRENKARIHAQYL